MRDSDQYNVIASDLHNIVPAHSRFDMKRTNTIFGDIDASNKANKCGIKRKLQVIEPPAHLKGDIARVIFYMNSKHQLPMLGNRSVLEEWAEQDPPSEEEKARDIEIESLQNNNNPYVQLSAKEEKTAANF